MNEELFLFVFLAVNSVYITKKINIKKNIIYYNVKYVL